jgi:hypothetical protein
MGQHRREGAAEYVVVQRPGVVRLAETALTLHTDAVLARRRGEIITDLAKTLSGAGVTASVSMAEPSGAVWSMSVEPTPWPVLVDAVRADGVDQAVNPPS